MTRKINFILLSCIIFLQVCMTSHGSPALAQENNEITGFNTVELQLLPEFDDPGLLVILGGRIEGAEPPVLVRFLVPVTARINATASKDAENIYSEPLLERTASEIPGWDTVSYELTTDTFWMEYYDPIVTGYPDKTIAYEFRWLYPITDIQVAIQEPINSTNYTVSPEGTIASGGGGFTFHTLSVSPDIEEQPLRFDISYTRSDQRLSLAIIGVDTPPATETTTADDGTSTLLWAVLIAVAVCGAIAGGYILIRRAKPASRAERRQQLRNKLAKAVEREPVKSRPGARFCTECGEPVNNQDKFCPHCGNKLGIR